MGYAVEASGSDAQTACLPGTYSAGAGSTECTDCPLGAYQAGAYEALAETGYSPQWLAGISIGAINAALIAGNPPEKRLSALRTFWETVSSSLMQQPILGGDAERRLLSQTAAWAGSLFGIPGFFKPRMPPPFAAWLPGWGQGSKGALSYYDTAPLRASLEKLPDCCFPNGEVLEDEEKRKGE